MLAEQSWLLSWLRVKLLTMLPAMSSIMTLLPELVKTQLAPATSAETGSAPRSTVESAWLWTQEPWLGLMMARLPVSSPTQTWPQW